MFCSTLGSISLLLFLKRIKNVKVLSYWGSNSLIIMCSHLQIIRVFEALHIDTNNFFIGLAILIFILAVEYVIITIINKYMPFLLGKSIKNNSNKLNMQYTQ
jgi:fucose 4-O-acetylase-like acetyltransferase